MQQLAHVESIEVGADVGQCEVAQRELPASEVQRRDTCSGGGDVYRDEQAVPLSFEQSGVGNRARRHDAGNAAVDRSFRCRRIADLLADRDRLAVTDQLRQVLVDCVIGHARHRNRIAGRLAARGERDIEKRRRPLRVAVEHLVEVAHAVEHELVGMLGLHPQVLLHHRRVRRQRRLGRQRAIIHCRHYMRRRMAHRRLPLTFLGAQRARRRAQCRTRRDSCLEAAPAPLSGSVVLRDDA